jgi:hypothetical protein
MPARIKTKRPKKKKIKKRDAQGAALVKLPTRSLLPEKPPHLLLTLLIPFLIAFALSTEPSFC